MANIKRATFIFAIFYIRSTTVSRDTGGILIPAEELEEFKRNIVEKIEMIAEFHSTQEETQ